MHLCKQRLEALPLLPNTMRVCLFACPPATTGPLASNPLGALGMRPYVLPPAKQATPAADAGASAVAGTGQCSAGKQATAGPGKRAREAAEPFGQPAGVAEGPRGSTASAPGPALLNGKRHRGSDAGARSTLQDPTAKEVPKRPRLHFDTKSECVQPDRG
jgi:hypothetical protein